MSNLTASQMLTFNNNTDKGYCFDQNLLVSARKPNTKTLFHSPKFIAKSMNSLEESRKFSNPLTPSSKTFKKSYRKSIEIIEENPYYNSKDDINEESETENNNNENIFQFKENNSKNIFRQRKILPNYSEYNMGPRYNLDGKILQRSILGEAETFLKIQNIIMKNTEIPKPISKDKRMSIMKGTSSPTREKTKDLAKSITSLNSSSSINVDDFEGKKKKNGNASIISAKKSTDPSKYKNTIRIARDEINQDIKKVEERQITNSEQDKKLLEALPKQDQLFFTKEQRILKKFHKTQENWQKTSHFLSSKLQRRPNTCLIENNDDFRLKIENAETLDLLKNDDEKYGNAYWTLTLRDYPTDYRIETKTLFKKSKMNFYRNKLEIVRKTSNGDELLEKTKNSHIKNEYLKEKLMKNKKKLMILKPFEEKTIGNLQVVGISKLNSETGVFKNEKVASRVYVKQRPIKQEPDEINQETYDEQYYSRELFMKTGSNIFPKITASFNF